MLPIIVLSVMAIGLLIWAALESDRDEVAFPLAFGIILIVVVCILGVFLPKEQYNEGQIDALKGIQTHEIHYVFPQGDTIPSDTLYLKIVD